MALQTLTCLKNYVILAPAGAVRHSRFDHIWKCDQTYSRLLAEMQRLRGRTYLSDGALAPEALTQDGRHQSQFDERSWHLLTLDSNRRVLGCLRMFMPTLSRIHRRNVKRANISKLKIPGLQLQKSVGSILSEAKCAGLSYVEIGGWALATELRNTTEGLRGILATYAWSQHTGGALGVSTATERNSSRLILQRLGGEALDWKGEPFAPYFDTQYQCKMELLRFDSRRPNSKYNSYIDTMRNNFSAVPVICPAGRKPWKSVRSSVMSLIKAPLWTEELLAGFC